MNLCIRKKYLFFGKDQIMTILIEKEDFLCPKTKRQVERIIKGDDLNGAADVDTALGESLKDIL